MSHPLLQEAEKLDRQYSSVTRREQFAIPLLNGKEAIYLCGNSLGPMPVKAPTYIEEEVAKWKHYGVRGHHKSSHPWVDYHENVTAGLCHVLGAEPDEVVAMNSLTTNLHLLLTSFYRPTQKRSKIIIELDAFPSDHYAVASHIRTHGFDPAESLITIAPDQEDGTWSHDHLFKVLKEHQDETALVMLSGIHYISGQVFPMEEIAQFCQSQKITCGFDLAHAVGNIPLNLRDSAMDFAVFCCYKYLNSGPGTIGGIFVHRRWHDQFAAEPPHSNAQRLHGWWGHNKEERFQMKLDFKPLRGAEAWQLSNPPIFQLAALRAGLEVFQSVSMTELRQKGERLTDFLIEALKSLELEQFFTFVSPPLRGSQLSLRIKKGGAGFVERLEDLGVVVDFRRPDTLRVAPAPLFNTFEEVGKFCLILKELLSDNP